MARRKKGSTLFEAFGDGMKVPDWLDSPEKPARQKARQEDSSLTRSTEIDKPLHNRPAAAQMPQLEISLSYISCGVIALVAIMLLVGAFKLGQMSKSTSPAAGQATDLTQGQTQDRGDYDYARVQELASQSLPSGSLLVVQENIASLDDAIEIQKYLWQLGLTTLVNSHNGNIAVIDTQNIDDMTSDEIAGRLNTLAEFGSSGSWQLSDKYNFSNARIEKR